VYTRDQQIVTARGVIMGRLATPQREMETEVMRLVWRALGVPILAEMGEDMFLEGGDFIVHSPDLCFLGVGLRTNMKAARFLMNQDLFGTRRVVIVVDDRDRSQARMHLDTVFNLADACTAVMFDATVGESAPLRRTAHVYARSAPGEPYTLDRVCEFSQFLRDDGFRIVPISPELQMGYAVNFVHTGHDNGTVVAVSAHLETELRKFGCDVPVHMIDYSGITRMYGAAHCSTQILRRAHRAAGA
jgi:arginine deiminase